MSIAPRTVQCYHCDKPFDVPARAMSISCPWCYTRVTLDDLVVKDTCWTSKVQTCGKIIIHRRGTLVSSSIEARGGMVIHGGAEGRLVSGGPVWIGRFARVKGDLIAPTIDIEPGARIEGGFFRISTAPPIALHPDAGRKTASGTPTTGPTPSPVTARALPRPMMDERRVGTDATLRATIKMPGIGEIASVIKHLRPT